MYRGTFNCVAEFLIEVIITNLLVVHGHSPYSELVKRFEDDLIVAIGKGEPVVVMSEDGFRKVMSIDEYASYYKDIDPLAPFKTWKVGQTDSYMSAKVHPSYDVYSERVKGVFVVSDPVDWGRDLQVLCDILSTGGLPGTEKGNQPPLYFAADDLEYQTSMEVKDCQFSTIYMVGDNPKVDINGAMKTSMEVKDCQFSTIYMVGDNPKVDINGAMKWLMVQG
ncbi:unnamed protein product [Miscanthus lutarioriparius]|uniref:Uncharacterized protein n=1 Tax=Miscanthus lutarioriparius TaxID=422564 RepID=A0A811MBI0_9POAL|nr:unnamed protein product [Miscanthus lutarioriparius]